MLKALFGKRSIYAVFVRYRWILKLKPSVLQEKKKAFAACICLRYHTHLIKSLKILTCNIFLCKYLILQCGHPGLIIQCGLYKNKMDFLFKIRGCGLYSAALYSSEFTVNEWLGKYSKNWTCCSICCCLLHWFLPVYENLAGCFIL